MGKERVKRVNEQKKRETERGLVPKEGSSSPHKSSGAFRDPYRHAHYPGRPPYPHTSYPPHPSPYPPHPSHMSHPSQMHNGYPGNGADMYHYPPPMYPPHMYPMPQGYGMRSPSGAERGIPHPGHRMRPPGNEKGIPLGQGTPAAISEEKGIPPNDGVKAGEEQGIPLAQTMAVRSEKGVPPPGYGMPPREGFPPGYGMRSSDMELGFPPGHGWPVENEQGFPPGYSPWHRHHGYPSPSPLGTCNMTCVHVRAAQFYH